MGSLCNDDAEVTQADRDAAKNWSTSNDGTLLSLSVAMARHRQASIAQHEGGRGEPVAWMYERNGCFVLKKNRTPEYTSPVIGHTETALYAQPPATRPADHTDCLARRMGGRFVPMSECNKCGERYPSAPAGTIHKCGKCSGGYCSPVAATRPAALVGGEVEALAAAVERLRLPVKVDALNAVQFGKPDFTAMIVREEEPGCMAIIAQQLSDQDAEDICTILNFAVRAHAKEASDD